MVRAAKTIASSVRKIASSSSTMRASTSAPPTGGRRRSSLGRTGGLTPADRRRVERNLYDGTLRGVTATSSLELGVDIAALDGVVMVGFPVRSRPCGSAPVAAAPQIRRALHSDRIPVRHRSMGDAQPAQAPHHGRRGLDHRHGNPIVVRRFLCAAKERPLTPADEAIFDAQGRLYREAIASLHAAEKLVPLPFERAATSSSRGRASSSTSDRSTSRGCKSS